MHDCVSRHMLSFLLSLCITIHTDDMCYFTGLLDGDVLLIGDRLYPNFKHTFVVQGLMFMMVPNTSSSNAIWRRNKGTYGDKCFALAEAPLFT